MGRFLTRIAISSAAIMIASAICCVAVVFLVLAFYLLLAGIVAPWLAALATAGTAILFAVFVLVFARLATRMAAAPPAARARMSAAAELGEVLGRQARDFVTTNSQAALAIVLVAGFAIGISPRLRKLLLKLL